MNTIKQIVLIAKNSFYESVKSRFFSLFCIFAFVILYSSVLASMLAISHEERVLADIALLLIELTAMVYAVFQITSSMSNEIENKTVYLILSRPISKPVYLAGKELGVIFTSVLIFFILGIMAALVIKSRSLNIPDSFIWSLLGSFIKVAILTSFSLFMSLIATSAISTFILSCIFWILCHITSQIEPLMQQVGGIKLYLLKMMSVIFPNFSLYSIRDYNITCFPFDIGALSAALLWIIAAYLLSLCALSKKEF